jgi:hypothetical protein
VTSPPYWGLRDYGVDGQIGLEQSPDCLGWATGDECGECFVCSLVGVFREVRRVLAAHGTCWLNLGDSYASKARGSDARLGQVAADEPGVAAEGAGGVAAEATGSGTAARSRRAEGEGPRRRPVARRARAAGGRLVAALRRRVVEAERDAGVDDGPADEGARVRVPAREERPLLLRPGRGARSRTAAELARRNPQASAATSRAARSREASATGPLGERGRSRLHDRSARNLRSVWEITTQPFKGAHFAVFPPKLAERCVLAGCPLEVCTVCGKPRTRIVEKGEPVLQADTWSATGAAAYDDAAGGYELADESSTLKHVVPRVTVGWSDCGHGAFRPAWCSTRSWARGTTALVARSHGRHSVGVELNPEYAALRTVRGPAAAALGGADDGDRVVLTRRSIRGGAARRSRRRARTATPTRSRSGTRRGSSCGVPVTSSGSSATSTGPSR